MSESRLSMVLWFHTFNNYKDNQPSDVHVTFVLEVNVQLSVITIKDLYKLILKYVCGWKKIIFLYHYRKAFFPYVKAQSMKYAVKT